MKANELMVGDFFLYKGSVVEIVSIDGGTETVWIDGKKVSALRKVNDLQPIQLTPKILEKNGIVYDYDQEECVADYTYIKVKGYQYHDENVLIDYYNGHIKLINDITNTVVDMNINYVHELQHALKLCGIEKTIEL